MSSVRKAVIDVGTNSVKLLVADVSGSQVRPVWEGGKQTRLGSGSYVTNQLQPEAIAKTAQAVAHFAGLAHEHKASSIRVIATSAARDAVNAGDLVSAIESAAGLKAEIISGEQEAELVFRGVTAGSELATQPLLLLDVGGGSTEFILGQGDHKRVHQSFPLGTVRLLERIPHSDPPAAEELAACRAWLKDFFAKEVRPKLEPALQREAQLCALQGPLQLVGTGGTASILARLEQKLEAFDRERIEGLRVTLEQIRWHLNHLWSLPLSERLKIVGLPRKRGDVILTGAAIYEAVMNEFQLAELRVSTRGLRFAAVMDEGTEEHRTTNIQQPTSNTQ